MSPCHVYVHVCSLYCKDTCSLYMCVCDFFLPVSLTWIRGRRGTDVGIWADGRRYRPRPETSAAGCFNFFIHCSGRREEGRTEEGGGVEVVSHSFCQNKDKISRTSLCLHSSCKFPPPEGAVFVAEKDRKSGGSPLDLTSPFIPNLTASLFTTAPDNNGDFPSNVWVHGRGLRDRILSWLKWLPSLKHARGQCHTSVMGSVIQTKVILIKGSVTVGCWWLSNREQICFPSLGIRKTGGKKNNGFFMVLWVLLFSKGKGINTLVFTRHSLLYNSSWTIKHPQP